ncbi:MAG: DUF885 domain-containing protein [Planctomycetes bacterium]|nr:DUF885 domain-containing protein [Planctomycetota bacterium]
MIDQTNLLRSARRCFAAGLALLVVAASVNDAAAQGLDRVRNRNGIVSGKITKMTALGITLTKSGVKTKLPVEEIVSVTFAGEPEDLTPARRAADAGRFEKALEKLNKIDRGEVERAEITQEIDFLFALCKAQLALSGQGTLDRAKKDVARFLSTNSKSFRVPAAIELLGDVLLASQDYAGARAQYAKLGKAPAPYFKARSAILTGRSLHAEGKAKEAVAAFEQALQAAEGNTVAESQKLEATLHRAISQAALGEVEQSTDTVKKLIQQADAEDTKLLAQAYNALGDCYLQADKKKAARQAFLHVDLLFSATATEHAKALYELSRLWEELGQPARSRDAQARLKDKYPGSRWANR